MNNSSIETDVAGFVAKYAPAIAVQLRDARAKVRMLFPRGYELVYDNYNALVFGFGPTERASDALISIAGYTKWVNLFFLKGAGLKDPKLLLHGSGKTVRSIRLASAEFLETSEVLQLIEQIVKPYRAIFDEAPPLSTIIKSVSKRQRPRRPPPPA